MLAALVAGDAWTRRRRGLDRTARLPRPRVGFGFIVVPDHFGPARLGRRGPGCRPGDPAAVRAPRGPGRASPRHLAVLHQRGGLGAAAMTRSWSWQDRAYGGSRRRPATRGTARSTPARRSACWPPGGDVARAEPWLVVGAHLDTVVGIARRGGQRLGASGSCSPVASGAGQGGVARLADVRAVRLRRGPWPWRRTTTTPARVRTSPRCRRCSGGRCADDLARPVGVGAGRPRLGSPRPTWIGLPAVLASARRAGVTDCCSRRFKLQRPLILRPRGDAGVRLGQHAVRRLPLGRRRPRTRRGGRDRAWSGPRGSCWPWLR